MLSQSQQKLIHSLEQKKYRQRHGLFVAEGPKVVGDLLQHGPAVQVFATAAWISAHGKDLAASIQLTEVSDDELRRISFLQHPQQVLALFPLTSHSSPLTSHPSNDLMLALDGIQDPGNMGTIIRLADWFGIRTILCSHDTADAWNPKVVQATMGSIARVSIIYTSLTDYLSSLPPSTPVYGTLLDGQDIYSQALTPNGIIVMGNEANGISPAVRQMVTHRLLIPRYMPLADSQAESLNVAIATAITCSEFRRQTVVRGKR